MAKLKLTDRLISALKSNAHQEDYWDILTPGFGLRVTVGGKKSFFCRYRVGNSQRRMVIGEYPGIGLSEARKKFRAIMNRVDDGRDPQLDKHQARIAETVGELFENFFHDREGRISDETLKRYRGIYRREFEKPLASIKAKEIRKVHVIPILRALSERALTQCERAEELLQACFNHSVALDLLEFNPLQQLPTFGKTRIGERYLSSDEIAKYLQIIEQFPVVEKVYFYLLIFYGARPGELSKWRWAWIGQDRIVIPSEYQKNNKSLTLPITSVVGTLISELRLVSGHTLWLFPNPEETTSRSSFRKFKVKLESDMGSNIPFTLRDIRRTTETQLRELRTPPDVVSVILNHNTSHLRKIYDKSENIQEKREVLIKYERFMNQLRLHGAPSNIVNFGAYLERKVI